MADDTVKSTVTEETKVEAPETPEVEPSEPEVSEETEETEEENPAQELWDALTDPRTARDTIKELARRTGLQLKEEETPPTPKKVKRAVKEILKDQLGSSYSFLAEPLGAAIETVLNAEREELQETITTAQRQFTGAIVAQKVEDFMETNSVTMDEQKQLHELVAMYPPSVGTPIQKYLQPLLELVRSRKERVTTDKLKREKVAANRRSTAAFTPSANEPSGEVSVRLTPRRAIEKALRQLGYDPKDFD